MVKTLLIIGAGHEQVPAIEIARSMGCRVVVTDRNPSAPGVPFADKFHEASTGDREANLKVAREEGINGVMTLGSETAVPVVAYIAEELSLPGFSTDTAYKATNKNAMREAFAAHDVPAPVSQPVATVEEAAAFAGRHGFPIVVKPSDCSGQRGTTRVDALDQLEAAVSVALPFATDNKAIVETFVEGPEINVTAVVTGGQVHFLSLSDRVTAAPPHFGIAIEHVSPPAISSDMAEAIKSASVKAIQAIGLTDGIAYPQVIAGTNGKPYVLEIASRIPGGHMREVAWLMSGTDMIEVAILQALGEPEPLKKCRSEPPVSALSVKFITELDFPDHAGAEVTAIEGLNDAQTADQVCLARLYLQCGKPLPVLTSSAARFGAVIAAGKDRATACAASRSAAERIKLTFRPR